MGIQQRTRRFLDKSMRTVAMEFEGCRMLELGNQIVRGGAHRGAAKTYFQGLGVYHTSVDINGKNGALPIDLREPMNLGEFDIVTNFGTTEHIAEQWPVFSNIHNACKIGGLIVHVVPGGVYHGRPHGLWGYEEKFFEVLARKCGYELRLLKTYERGQDAKYMHEVFCALQKRGGAFLAEAEFMALEGLQYHAQT